MNLSTVVEGSEDEEEIPPDNKEEGIGDADAGGDAGGDAGDATQNGNLDYLTYVLSFTPYFLPFVFHTYPIFHIYCSQILYHVSFHRRSG